MPFFRRLPAAGSIIQTTALTLARPISALVLGLGLSISVALTAPAMAADPHLITSQVVEADLSEKKRTTPGLYITAAETADLMAAGADVLLVDVRSPEETMFVGYPTETDANIPFKLVDPAHRYNAEKTTYAMIDNPGFVASTRGFLDGKSPSAVIIMCRSGARSAAAVNALAEAGIDLPLYTMVDGFEGGKDADGQRNVNGWKVSGAPWTYAVRGDLLISND